MSRTQLNLSIIIVAVTLAAMLSVRNGTTLGREPAPIDAPGLHVLIVAESETDVMAALPAGQQDIIGSVGWRADWQAKGGKVRILDPTHDQSFDDPKWTNAAAKLKTANIPLPAFAISDGNTGETGTLPLSLAEWESKLEKFGGTQ